MEETGRLGLAGTPAACAVRPVVDGRADGCAAAPGCPPAGWAVCPAGSGPGAAASGDPAGAAAAVAAEFAGAPDPAAAPLVPGPLIPCAAGAAGAGVRGAVAVPDAGAALDAAAAEAGEGAGEADDGEVAGAGVAGAGVCGAVDEAVPEVGSGRLGRREESVDPVVTDADAPALSDVCAVGSWGGTASSAKDAWTPVERTSTAPTAAAAAPRRSPPWIPVRDIESSDLC
ncbi:hypothetical protein [Pseudarthrobacter sp. fls2-241-R2A-127]|uniref:hypothetical protein n=1 Tax=Pseudarthrobacter sp. fls2-241-R2A-127 TaxID=3040303 RepID=UPI0025558760|nr:hypothetical protein [Pseudarthrobacter sp. fls2-241-R2A-127]